MHTVDAAASQVKIQEKLTGIFLKRGRHARGQVMFCLRVKQAGQGRMLKLLHNSHNDKVYDLLLTERNVSHI